MYYSSTKRPMGFFKTLFTVILGVFIALFLLFFVGIGSIISSIPDGDAKQITVQDTSILLLDLSDAIGEIGEPNPLPGLSKALQIDDAGVQSILNIKKALKKAAEDDMIKGLQIEMSAYTPISYAVLNELNMAVRDFKQSGKFIVSYGKYIGEKSYLIASASDHIITHPRGILEFNGMSATVTYYKDMLKKIGVKPEVFRVGSFKSAVEPFMQTKMSSENRLQLSELLNGLQGEYINAVAQNASLELSSLNNIADSMLIRSMSDAVKYGLVDKVGYRDELDAYVREKMGTHKDAKIKRVDIENYASSSNANNIEKDKIAFLGGRGSSYALRRCFF